MEQQKVLWVIFSVALFVLVVIGIGVIWFLPNNRQTAKVATSPNSTDSTISFDPYEWAKSGNAAQYPGLEGPQPQGDSTATGNKDFTIIYGPTGQSSQQGGQTQTQQAPVQTVPAPTATPASIKTSEHHEPDVAKQPAKTVRVAEHWIQAASYASDSEAEQARKLLGANGITSIITSHDVGGTTYFRVRIGPYGSEAEADKFLGLVKQIDGFETSFVTLAYENRSAQ